MGALLWLFLFVVVAVTVAVANSSTPSLSLPPSSSGGVLSDTASGGGSGRHFKKWVSFEPTATLGVNGGEFGAQYGPGNVNGEGLLVYLDVDSTTIKARYFDGSTWQSAVTVAASRPDAVIRILKARNNSLTSTILYTDTVPRLYAKRFYWADQTFGAESSTNMNVINDVDNINPQIDFLGNITVLFDDGFNIKWAYKAGDSADSDPWDKTTLEGSPGIIYSGLALCEPNATLLAGVTLTTTRRLRVTFFAAGILTPESALLDVSADTFTSFRVAATLRRIVILFCEDGTYTYSFDISKGQWDPVKRYLSPFSAYTPIVEIKSNAQSNKFVVAFAENDTDRLVVQTKAAVLSSGSKEWSSLTKLSDAFDTSIGGAILGVDLTLDRDGNSLVAWTSISETEGVMEVQTRSINVADSQVRTLGGIQAVNNPEVFHYAFFSKFSSALSMQDDTAHVVMLDYLFNLSVSSSIVTKLS